MRVSNQLLKDIHPEGQARSQRILDKMEYFEESLIAEKKGISGLASGFYARKIAGTDIYKFRVSSGDRILFKYVTQENNQTGVYFIRYCKHDEQIRAAHNFRSGGGTVDYESGLDIVVGDYEEDETDIKINDYVRHEVYTQLEQVKVNDVFDDEYISLAAESDKEESIKYLSIEQYNCLKRSTKPIIILGCAGSGKTVIALRRLMMNRELGMKTAYVSQTDFIVNKTQERYELACGADDNTSFYTFKILLAVAAKVELNNVRIIDYKHFHDWFHNSGFMQSLKNRITCKTAWLEINTLIKGSLTEDDALNQEQYNNRSALKETEKRTVYKIYDLYRNWTESHCLYDTNDLARLTLRNADQFKKFDYFVCDEAQELTEKQVAALISCFGSSTDVLLLADANQATQITRFYLSIFKNSFFSVNLCLEEDFLIKNYRNGSETIHLLNAFKEIKLSKFKSSVDKNLQHELYVKEGVKPKILHNYEKIGMAFFEELSQASNTAIVVPDENGKAECEKIGFNIHRIFTVEEIRGLEYDNIFCVDVLSSYEYVWDKIILSNDNDDRYAVYFNMVYIAATRARENLVFLEKKETCLDKHLSGYLNVIKSKDELESFIKTTTSEGDWLQEAIRLEQSGNFYQASEAYINAGMVEDANACLNAYERDQITSYGASSNVYLQIIVNGTINPETWHQMPMYLEKAISALYEKYNCVMCGTVYIFVPIPVSLNSIKAEMSKIFVDVDMISIEKTATAIDMAATYRYRHYVISTHLFELDASDPDKPKPNFLKPVEPGDLTIIVDNSSVSIQTGVDKIIKQSFKALFKEMNDYIDENTPLKLLNAAQQIRNKNKYTAKTSDDILNYIFGENKKNL